MKVIFLDIDGVLNSTRSDEVFKSPLILDPVCCELLVELVQATKAKIVISSDWRLYSCSDSNFNSRWNKAFLVERHHQILTEALVGYTDRGGPNRYDEIQRWLEKHKECDKFVIIDDTRLLEFEDKPSSVSSKNFVLVDSYIGLSLDDMETALSILGKE